MKPLKRGSSRQNCPIKQNPFFALAWKEAEPLGEIRFDSDHVLHAKTFFMKYAFSGKNSEHNVNDLYIVAAHILIRNENPRIFRGMGRGEKFVLYHMDLHRSGSYWLEKMSFSESAAMIRYNEDSPDYYRKIWDIDWAVHYFRGNRIEIERRLKELEAPKSFIGQ